MTKTFNKIISNALPEPKCYIKNSILSKELITQVNVSNSYVLVSLDVSSFFKNSLLELVLKGIEKKWDIIQNNTKISIHELKQTITFLTESTLLNSITLTINKLLKPQ